jgi:hypothetical protein
VFCLPCRHEADGNAEGFPVVLVEAMACGTPVITTRHVEIPRIVEQILVDENDVDALAEAIQRVYSSPTLREQLGNRNRELAEEHFSTKNVSQTIRLLSRIAGLSVDISDQRDDSRLLPCTPETGSVAANQLVGSNEDALARSDAVRGATHQSVGK